MVDRCVGDGPAEGNQLDPGERDVSVFGGGDPATLKEFEEMVCKDFVGPGPSSDLYPSANEEVDSTALHYTVCHPFIRKVTRGLIHLKSSEPDSSDSSDRLDVWSRIASVSPPV